MLDIPLIMSQVYLRRNHEGEIDPEGEIWAAPYRWGSMVIAYKKSKFQEHKLAPIEVFCLTFFLLHGARPKHQNVACAC
jgi:hypothetical protein